MDVFVIVCTDLSDTESQGGMGKMVTSESLGGVLVSTLTLTSQAMSHIDREACVISEIREHR